MSEQEQLAIRVALARRMGITLEKRWQHATDPTWCLYDVRLPDGTYLGSHCGSIEEAASKLPDPFTSAAANRELVKWLAADAADDALFDNYIKELWRLSGSKIEEWKGRPDLRVKILLTAPLETITLAAAKALGIETE